MVSSTLFFPLLILSNSDVPKFKLTSHQWKQQFTKPMKGGITHRHCTELYSQIQIYLEPVNMILLGSRVFADVLKLK